jgi:glycosyltransferase involved in cell wall biosynthesis
MKMCQAFVKNGHTLVLQTPSRPDIDLKVDDVYKFYGVDPCFEMRKLPWLPLKGCSYIYNVQVALQTKRIAPDIVYGRYLQGCYFCSLMKLPIIYEAHMLPTNLRYLDACMHSSLIQSPNLKRLVLISNTLKHDYREKYHIEDSLAMVAHDAADEPRMHGYIDVANPHRLQVGYIGNLYPGKGMEIIVEIARACSWADFHIVGGLETERRYWETQTAGLDNVIYYGFIPHVETDRYRLSSDILIAPYLHEVFVYGNQKEVSRWMSPLKIFEYMAAGKPILTSNLPVLQEILVDGDTALLCDPNNVQSWIEALSNLRSNAELRKSLGRQARAEFEAFYTWQARANCVLKDL